MNDDDEAFQSFLEDEEASNDLLLSSSNKDDEPIEIDQELNHRTSNSEPNESENTNIHEPNGQQEDEGLLEEGEVYFENEEEEIDDEMEGDED